MASDYTESGISQGFSFNNNANLSEEADSLDAYGVWVKSGPRGTSDDAHNFEPSSPNSLHGNSREEDAVEADAADFNVAEIASAEDVDPLSENVNEGGGMLESVDMSFFDEPEQESPAPPEENAPDEVLEFEDIDFEHLALDDTEYEGV